MAITARPTLFIVTGSKEQLPGNFFDKFATRLQTDLHAYRPIEAELLDIGAFQSQQHGPLRRAVQQEMEVRTQDSLSRGRSVVFGALLNKLSARDDKRVLAENLGARSLLVVVTRPREQVLAEAKVCAQGTAGVDRTLFPKQGPATEAIGKQVSCIEWPTAEPYVAWDPTQGMQVLVEQVQTSPAPQAMSTEGV